MKSGYNWAKGICRRVSIQTIFFDLDETIYPATSGVWPAISRRIESFLSEVMHFPEDQITEVRTYLYHTYGTTLRGLQVEHHVDTLHYLAYVHDIPLEDYLRPDPALRETLLGLTQRRVIFTNADRAHAGRVIQAVGLEGCFEQIIDILDIMPYCKPQPEAFEIALRLARNPDPRECAVVDDSPANLQTAHALGMKTIGVAGRFPSDDRDAVIEKLADLPVALAGLEG